MTQLVFTKEELFSDHEFARPHEIGGQRLHGGFLEDGSYCPPRAKARAQAIKNWTAALRARGGELFAADASLLSGPRVPNVEQQRLLIREGLGQTFWNGLTITGKIEARGRVLSEMAFPDLQEIVVEDISEMALGHLNKGLLDAHGIDEGGEPDKGIGGHDVMWFVARDRALGANAFPDVDPPDSIARPEAGQRWMPEIGPGYEAMLSFLMNLLIIEFRAEIGFANTQATLRTPGLFADAAAAEEAAEIVGRIRTDEEIHVESLRLYLGELENVTLRTVDGGTVAGRALIERFWAGLVEWATVDQPKLAAERQYGEIKTRILAHEDGERILETFDKLSDPSFSIAAG